MPKSLSQPLLSFTKIGTKACGLLNPVRLDAPSRRKALPPTPFRCDGARDGPVHMTPHSKGTLMRLHHALLLSTLVAATSGHAQTPDAKTSQEIFQDWRLNCVEKSETKRCVVNQTLSTQQGQAVAAINASLKDKSTVLEFALPLMMDLTTPLTIKIDDRAATTYAFNTCSPRACFVVRDNDKALISGFEAGTTAVLSAKTFNGQSLTLNVSLKGFGAATKALKQTK